MTSRATIAEVAICSVPMATNQGFINLLPRDGIDSTFLYYRVRHLKPELERLSSGSTFLELSKSTFRRVTFLVPPLAEQRRIAEVLSSVDDAIEATEAVIDRLAIVKRGLMQTLLTRGIPGRHERFKQTEIGEVPEEWAIEKIGDVGRVHAGRQRSPNFIGEERPYLRVANVFDGFINSSDVLTMPFTDAEFERYRLFEGDVLLNEGQSIELVGRAAMYKGVPQNCAFQNTLVRFQHGERVDPQFATYLFRYLQTTGRFMNIAKRTTSIAHLGVSRFANMKLAWPTLQEQVEISSMLDAIESRVNAEALKVDRLNTLKRGLMEQMLTGKLRVPIRESDSEDFSLTNLPLDRDDRGAQMIPMLVPDA